MALPIRMQPHRLQCDSIRVSSGCSRNFRSKKFISAVIAGSAISSLEHRCEASANLRPLGVGLAYIFWQDRQVDSKRPFELTTRLKAGIFDPNISEDTVQTF